MTTARPNFRQATDPAPLAPTEDMVIGAAEEADTVEDAVVGMEDTARS